MLNEKMSLLEQKTKRIEQLVGQTKSGKKPQFDRRHSEDLLPKVIICGVTENNMPKLIVCDNKKEKKKDKKKPKSPLPPPDVVSIFF